MIIVAAINNMSCNTTVNTCISSTADALSKAIRDLHSLECEARNLRETKDHQTAILREVIAENAEKKKIGKVIEILKTFDPSKIKVCDATTNLITPGLIMTFESYHTRLYNTRRYDDDAQRLIDQTDAEILSTDKKIAEVRAHIECLKITYKQEKERLLNMIRDTDALLESNTDAIGSKTNIDTHDTCV